MSRTILVKRLSYSSNPWRLVDSLDERQIHFELQTVNIHERDTVLPVLGYPTKAEAVAALGRLAAKVLEQEAAA